MCRLVFLVLLVMLLSCCATKAVSAGKTRALFDYLPDEHFRVQGAVDKTDKNPEEGEEEEAAKYFDLVSNPFNRIPYDDVDRDYCGASSRFSGLLDCEYCRELWKDTMRVAVNGTYEEYLYLVTMLGNTTLLAPLYARNSSRFTDYIPEGYKLIDIVFPVMENKTGLHAFALQSIADPRKVIFAIRYTNASPLDFENLDGQADICAGWWLGRYNDRMPSFCANFSPEELNYVDHLADFMEKVLTQTLVGQENVCFLFTGYSLGNWIGQLASLAFHSSMPGIGFSAPGSIYTATQLNIPQADSSGLVDFYWDNDPIVRMGIFWTNKTGYLCPCPNDPTPEYCERCYVDNNFDFMNDTNSCAQCYDTEHRVRGCEPRPECSYVEYIASGGTAQVQSAPARVLTALFCAATIIIWFSCENLK